MEDGCQTIGASGHEKPGSERPMAAISSRIIPGKTAPEIFIRLYMRILYPGVAPLYRHNLWGSFLSIRGGGRRKIKVNADLYLTPELWGVFCLATLQEIDLRLRDGPM